MKRLFFLSLLCFAACQSPVKQNSAVEQPKGEPKFVIQEEIHNFGTVHAGELLSYSFKFKNEGTGKLHIDNVETDCGCIEVSYPDEATLPGDSGFVEVLFNSAGEVGQVLKQIRVYYNESKTPRELIITASVKNEFININN